MSKEKIKYLISTVLFLFVSVIIGIFVYINSFLGYIYLLMLVPFLILFTIPLFNNDFNKTSFKIGIIFAYLTFIPVYFTLTFKSSSEFGGYALIFFVWPLMGIFAMVSWVAMLIGIFSRNKENKIAVNTGSFSNEKLSGQLILVLILDLILLPFVLLYSHSFFGQIWYHKGDPLLFWGSILLYFIVMLISFIQIIKRKRSGLYTQGITLIFGLIFIVKGFFSKEWVFSAFLSPLIITIIFCLFYLFFNKEVKEILKR